MRKFRKFLFGVVCRGEILRVRHWFPDFDGTGDDSAGTGQGGGPASSATSAPPPDVQPQTNNVDQRDPGTSIDPNAPAPTPAQAQRQPAADPNQRANAPATQQQAAEWQSIRDAARAYGHNFGPEVTDDRAALIQLLQIARRNTQSDFYARLGQQIAPHVGPFQQYMQGQRAPQTAQPQRQPWEAPEFDERWAGLVERDPTSGVYMAKPGVPPEIAAKVNAYVDWKAGFDRNPAAVLNAMVEQRSRAIAQETFQSQYAAQQSEMAVNQIIQANTPWLYQFNPDGSRTVNPVTGQPFYTPIGVMYVQHLQQLRAAGVTDPTTQDNMAKNYVRGQYAMMLQQQAQQQANPQAQQATNRTNQNPLQGLPPSQRRQTPGATDPTTVGKSLTEMLREDLAAEGVTDADIMASMG